MDRKVIVGILVACVVLVGAGVMIGSKNGSGNVDTGAEILSEDMNILASDWTKGSPTADVTLLEYGDFQCPACSAYYFLLKDLIAEYPTKVRIVYRQYPLTAIHDKSYDAARAAEAAGKQGKFWEMHDVLFEKQKSWSEDGEYLKRFEEYAGDIGIVVEIWQKDFADAAIAQKVQADRQSGDRLGVSGTPTFFVNGQKINLPGSYDNMKAVIDSAASKVTPKPAETTHMHYDLAVYRNGTKFNFATDEYMETDDITHFHDNNGEVVHIHRTDATLGRLVESLGIDVTGPVSLVVNSASVSGDWKAYKPADLDRVIVVFGDAPRSTSVTDKACIYSEKCPERGTPPTENCVGGLDTPC